MNKLNILYEDNHIIVVEKKPNILSQSDNTHDLDLLTMVKEYIKEKYNKKGNVYLGLVHRLDRPVGGIMVFARTSKAASRLSKQIQDKKFKKYYFAITSKVLKEKKGKLTDYIEKLPNGNSIITTKEKGKLSTLEFSELEHNSKHSLVKIKLETGRHHQIRVQFANLGYPLCGDQRYGIEDKTQIALYAYHLEFIHPTTKEVLTFEKTPDNKGWWTEFTMSKFVK